MGVGKRITQHAKAAGVLLRVVGLLACIWFLNSKLPPVPSGGAGISNIHSQISLASLQAGILISITISGTVYILLAFGVGAKLIFSSDPVTVKIKANGFRIFTGLVFGFAVFFGSLMYFLAVQPTEPRLILCSLVLAAAVVIIDLLLGKKEVVEYLDVPVLATMILVVVADRYLSSAYKSEVLHSGFTCGSVAFQLLLANLSFDASGYTPSKIVAKF
jgi:hypothetical protein